MSSEVLWFPGGDPQRCKGIYTLEISPRRWAPKTSYKWGEITPLVGGYYPSFPCIRPFIPVITPFITIAGAPPPCKYQKEWFGKCISGFRYGVILYINFLNFGGVPQYFPRLHGDHGVSKRDEVGQNFQLIPVAPDTLKPRLLRVECYASSSHGSVEKIGNHCPLNHLMGGNWKF